jgi:hypothetical protein
MSSGNGDAHRLNSSMKTSFGETRNTICGRSIAAGTETGPTDTEVPDAAAAGRAAGLKV